MLIDGEKYSLILSHAVQQKWDREKKKKELIQSVYLCKSYVSLKTELY